jgi:hypothetical protein
LNNSKKKKKNCREEVRIVGRVDFERIESYRACFCLKKGGERVDQMVLSLDSGPVCFQESRVQGSP